MDSEEIDLYEVLGVQKGATKIEIKKAYHKAALSSHPDKAKAEERDEAEIRFKAVQQAYEILQDDDKRHMYDTHGMSAFDGSGGPGGPGGVDLDDIFAQMFGAGFPGMSGMPGAGARGQPKPKKGKSVVQEYEVTLEQLYKGKTTRFASTRNQVCPTCKGSGGKDKAKSMTCAACEGQGSVTGLRQIMTSQGPMLAQETKECTTCKGEGSVFREKDRCKKCKGEKTIEQKKMLELYIPRGSIQGDRIVLAGEADETPGQEPGDLIFELNEVEHAIFSRAGNDLQADLHVTLAEALTGFNRVVLTHLDGRGISLNIPQSPNQILRPDQVLKVEGEGMPIKKTEARGDLYLSVKIDFPEDGHFETEASVKKLRELLPGPRPVIEANEVDEVEFERNANIEEFGAGSGDPRAGGDWEDDDEDEGPQCAQQ